MSQPLNDDEAEAGPKRQYRRKNTRRWCKGVPGREHQPEIVRDKAYSFIQDKPCSARGWGWLGCYHVEECTVCGKILNHFVKDRCPDLAT